MENKLHFLLIHGAWHGSWAWKNVSSKLSEKNFKVSCPNFCLLYTSDAADE